MKKLFLILLSAFLFMGCSDFLPDCSYEQTIINNSNFDAEAEGVLIPSGSTKNITLTVKGDNTDVDEVNFNFPNYGRAAVGRRICKRYNCYEYTINDLPSKELTFKNITPYDVTIKSFYFDDVYTLESSKVTISSGESKIVKLYGDIKSVSAYYTVTGEALTFSRDKGLIELVYNIE